MLGLPYHLAVTISAWFGLWLSYRRFIFIFVFEFLRFVLHVKLWIISNWRDIFSVEKWKKKKSKNTMDIFCRCVLLSFRSFSGDLIFIEIRQFWSFVYSGILFSFFSPVCMFFSIVILHLKQLLGINIKQINMCFYYS